AALRGRPGNETKSDDEHSAKAAQRAAAKLHDRFLPLIPEADCPPFGITLQRRFIGAALFPTCAFPPVLRGPNSSPHWGLVSRPLAAAAGHGARAAARQRGADPCRAGHEWRPGQHIERG